MVIVRPMRTAALHVLLVAVTAQTSRGTTNATVVNCSCTHPFSWANGSNGYSCSNRSTGVCSSDEACSATTPFPFAAWENGQVCTPRINLTVRVFVHGSEVTNDPTATNLSVPVVLSGRCDPFNSSFIKGACLNSTPYIEAFTAPNCSEVSRIVDLQNASQCASVYSGGCPAVDGRAMVLRSNRSVSYVFECNNPSPPSPPPPLDCVRYTHNETRASADEAAAQCARLGGRLPIVNSSAIRDALLSGVPATASTVPWWLGLRKAANASLDDWAWADGTPHSASKWSNYSSSGGSRASEENFGDWGWSTRLEWRLLSSSSDACPRGDVEPTESECEAAVAAIARQNGSSSTFAHRLQNGTQQGQCGDGGLGEARVGCSVLVHNGSWTAIFKRVQANSSTATCRSSRFQRVCARVLPAQPDGNDVGAEQCARVRPLLGFRWYDTSCSFLQSVVCEIPTVCPPPPPPPLPPRPPQPPLPPYPPPAVPYPADARTWTQTLYRDDKCEVPIVDRPAAPVNSSANSSASLVTCTIMVRPHLPL